MTEEDIERLAELFFQKMLKKQEEWDKQFIEELGAASTLIGRDAIIREITELNLIKLEFVKNEEYEKAYGVQKKIKELGSQLSNDQG
jgi:protein-arginine kinase activator protein McsA